MKILITKRSSPEFSALLSRAEILLDFKEVLEIIPLPVRYPELSGYGVISSANAIISIQENPISSLPEIMFCVGQKSASRLSELGYKGTIHVYSRISQLCKELFCQKPGSIHYFCGVSHRHDLSNAAKAHPEFILKTYFCYKSYQLFPKLSVTDYDAICIFSPRAAESLFERNQFSSDQKYYCIGPVTAETVQSYGYTNITYLNNPSLTEMARTILKESYA